MIIAICIVSVVISRHTELAGHFEWILIVNTVYGYWGLVQLFFLSRFLGQALLHHLVLLL
jgi:hypothetical protein